MKIIHLTTDNLFVPKMARNFERIAPNQNKFIIYSSPANARFFEQNDKNIFVDDEATAQNTLRDSLKGCDLLVVHYMSGLWVRVLAKLDINQITVVWSGFGADYYGDAHSPYSRLLEPRTALLMKHTSKTPDLKMKIYRWRKRHRDQKAIQYIARNVDYFSAPVPTDQSVFRTRFPKFTGSYHQLNYTTSIEKDPGVLSPTGNDILVGNSSTPENNHLDTFDRLKKLDLDGRKVVVPLSYGLLGDYREAVIAEGKQKFGSLFMPLVNFLEPEDYRQTLSSCGVVLMGHLRQQALGNILTAVLAGSEVYLHAANPILHYFKQEGVLVRELPAIGGGSPVFIPLTNEERQLNRKSIERLWGEDVVLGNIKSLLSKVAEG